MPGQAVSPCSMPHEEAQAWQTITCSSAAEAKAKIRVIRPQWEHNKYGFHYNRILDVTWYENFLRKFLL
jgi:hypothetical protein